MSYIGTYLFDVIGMEPGAAKAYLKASIIGDRFRYFRIQVDKTYDPNVYDLGTEERQDGRVTFKTKDGLVSHAVYEDESGLGSALLYPTPWPPVVKSHERFVLGNAIFVGNMPMRHDVDIWGADLIITGLSRGQIPIEPLTVLPGRVPPVGWRIDTIESVHMTNDENAKTKREVPRKKPTVHPDFIEVI
jgi:hypothetical protein